MTQPINPVVVFDENLQAFLDVLSQGHTVKYAAEKAGLTYGAVQYHRRLDPEFGEAYAEAMELGTQTLEQEARRRAVDGIDKGIYHKGELVDTEKVYSDGLLTLLLKAKRPEVYRDNPHINVTQNNDNRSVSLDLGRLSLEELRELERIADAARPALAESA